jgi:hypothetical protein
MARIVEVLDAVNYGSHATVEVRLDNGETGIVWIGGQVEAWYDEEHGKYKVFVRKTAD